MDSSRPSPLSHSFSSTSSLHLWQSEEPPQHQSLNPCSSYEPWSDENVQHVMDLWQLTLRQQQLLLDLQRRVSDIHHSWNDPHVLVRYLLDPRGPRQAERLFRQMINWRLEHHVDDMLQHYQPCPCLLEYASPLAFLKDYDRDGDPIYVERGGAIDGEGLLKRFSQDALMRHAIWLRELQSSGPWVDDYERRQGGAVKEITVLYDLEGLSLQHCHPHVVAWFQSHIQMTDDYYPGPVKRIIILRAPAVFRVLWNCVKHFFPAESRTKMIFTTSHNYLKVLDKYVDLNILPPCINPQGRGQTAMGMPKSLVAGKIPHHIGKEGKGYLPTAAATLQPVPMIPPVSSTLPPVNHNHLLQKQQSHHTETTSTTSLDELDDNNDAEPYTSLDELVAATKLLSATRNKQYHGADWEEVIVSSSYHQTLQAHVFWQESTGVEVSHSHIVDPGRKIIFI